MMLKSIRQFFDTHLRPDDAGGPAAGERGLQLATAALLIEMTRADYEVKPEERTAVVEAIHGLFTNLSDQETAELIALAEQEVNESTSLFQFTSLVDKNFSRDEKVRIVEMLWRIAFADKHKDMNEEYLVRKIAELLHVSHKDFIRTRHIVEEELRKSLS